MPIPDAMLAFVPPEKRSAYLRNPSHPVGGPKARWLMDLGDDPDDPAALATDLLALVTHAESFTSRISPFGVKSIVKGSIVTPYGRTVEILSLWIREPHDRRARFVTAYPA